MKQQTVRKTDKRVKRTFEKLCTCFIGLLTEKSYEDITVLELCDKSGVHRATFYKHFMDKQDFVNFFFSEKIRELDLGDSAQWLFTENSKDIYLHICSQVIDFVYKHRKIITDMKLSGSSTSFFKAIEDAVSDAIEKTISPLSQENLISPLPMLSHFYAGAVVSLMRWWCLNGEQYTKADLMRFMLLRFNEVNFAYKSGINANL